MSIALLAGGQSRRMGRDKALIRPNQGGPTLIELVAAAASGLADDLMVIAPADRGYEGLLPGWRSVEDDVPGSGPAGGVVAALRSARHEWVLMLPCDAPRLSRPLLRMLIERAHTERPVVPWRIGETRQGIGRTLEVLHGVYPRSVLPALEASLASGERRLFKMVEALDPILIGPDELLRFDPGLASFRSVNLPEDVEQFDRELFGQRAHGIY